MKVDILSIYRKRKNRKDNLIHSYGLNKIDWDEKERLEKLIEKIPISYRSPMEESSFKAKVILKNKEIEIYPNAREYNILPWYFKINNLDGLDDLIIARDGLAFNFKDIRFGIYYISTIYQEKLRKFEKAIKEFNGF